MRTKTSSLIVTTILGAALTGCSSNPEVTTVDVTPPTSAPATLSPEALESARAAAGLPQDPTAEARQAYLDALNAIDRRIIKPGKDDQAVSRGINQCGSIKTGKTEDELAKTALERFTVDTRLPDIATPKTGKAINKAVHTHLCPDF